MDNPEKLTILGTQDTRQRQQKQKNTKQFYCNFVFFFSSFLLNVCFYLFGKGVFPVRALLVLLMAGHHQLSRTILR